MSAYAAILTGSLQLSCSYSGSREKKAGDLNRSLPQFTTVLFLKAISVHLGCYNKVP